MQRHKLLSYCSLPRKQQFQNPAQPLSTSLTGAASRHLLETPVNFTLRQQSFASPIPWAVIYLSSMRGKGDGSKRINIHVFKRTVRKHMACSPKMAFSSSLGKKRLEDFCLFSVWFAEASADQEIWGLSSTSSRDIQNCPKKDSLAPLAHRVRDWSQV